MTGLGAVLLSRGLVSPVALAEVEEQQEVTGQPLGVLLVQRGLLSEVDLMMALAESAGMEFVDLGECQVDSTAVAMIPADLARRHGIMPIGFDGGDLVVATANPGDVLAVDDIRSTTGRGVRTVVAGHRDVEDAIRRHYRADRELEGLSAEFQDTEQDGTDDPFGDEDDDTPVVRFVSLLVNQAITDGASDIHVEPGEHDLRVRYRIDGVLHEIQRAPRGMAGGVASRFKVLSDIDVAERRKPQDGRMSVNHHGKKVDLRVATLPTVWGEKIVMRILDNSTASLALTSLGLSEQNLSTYRRSYTKPHGMLLVTGPTGSGKSTTLYATLNVVSKPEINVITVEDPVEYRLPGINQVQVNAKAGLTFAAALRSILRSDPDVVLLGEIRDHETAQIAVEAALTGHLVLSTLHTNDAPSAVTRLTEMGIEPFLVGSALECVVAQRLARRLCSGCKERYRPDVEELVQVGFPIMAGETPPDLHRPVGCTACAGTGYKGRVALHEVMAVGEEIERLAVAHASAVDIGKAAVRGGMTVLREDGWMKALAGTTSIEEVLRVAI
ncbi:GspE/PulE family protein [Cellulomonas triticagri]|uniref:Type II secretion system protein GspE n=1 Tax=Cellulomonas triticagri TaxID=2483352 RepID=A0A3M2JQ37_9CELL|nr:ATPase, T2SS/T4P/T4SS family [Cellulomonas triticagri]RMI12835.1 type II secretion system protein GspE [Cellulomonas triticagri]